jgi:beta-N-acetylhexosaminidase
MIAAIVGIAGRDLSPDEAALFRAFPPTGVILFGRNIAEPRQLTRLMTDLRRVLPAGAVFMVDQEGGRVARLRPPYWRAHPPARTLGHLFERHPQAALRAAWLTGALIGADCLAAGFTVTAAPVLDLSIPGAHDVIGDRALAEDPLIIARLGRTVAAGIAAAGVQAVGKHVPGHGRSGVDSHLSLPRVEAKDLDADILPFARNADLPWMMTAHIVYPAFDPILPVTLSARAIGGIVRGRIGFKGVLVTDDLAMKALAGEPAELAVWALAAGCDVALYCSGAFSANEALLQRCPTVSFETAARLETARTWAARQRLAFDPQALAAERDRLCA